MRTLLVLPALFVLLVALAACASEDTAPPIVVGVTPEAIPEGNLGGPDGSLVDPVETVTPPTAVDAMPPALPSPLAETTPAVVDHPEGEHTMEDGMTMDSTHAMNDDHVMEDGMPMDHPHEHGDHDQ